MSLAAPSPAPPSDPVIFPPTNLAELHALHQRAQAVRDQLESGPKLKTARQALLARAQADLETAKQNLQREKLQQMRHETQLKTLQSRSDDLRVKLNAAKKNDEYNAILKDLHTNQTAIRQEEEAILEQMDKVETLTAEVARLESELAAKTRDHNEFVAQLETRLASQRTLLKRLEAALTQGESIVPESGRETYRRAIQRRGADAMAAVDNMVCTGCYVQITQQSFNDLHLPDLLVTCKSCSRILYFPTALENLLKRDEEVRPRKRRGKAATNSSD